MTSSPDIKPAGTFATNRLGSLDRYTSLALIALLLFGLFLLGHIWHSFPTDFSALFMASHFYATGNYDLIYDAPDKFFGAAPPLWAAYLPALGLEGQDVVPYVYPPIWAAALSPLSDLGAWAIFHAAALINVAALMGSVIVAWRLCESFAVPFSAWVCVSIPLLGTSLVTLMALFHLQPQIVVTFLILIAFDRYAQKAFVAAGIFLAIAAAMKIAPAGFALIFLLDRNGKSLAAFLGALVFLAAASLAIVGPDLHFAFLKAVDAASNQTLITSINFSITTLFYGLTQSVDWSARNIIIDPPLWIELATKLIGALALLWAILATQRVPDNKRLVMRVFLFGLLLNMFGPLGWAHYFLLQLFLIPVLLTLLPKPSGFVFVLGFGLATSWAALTIMRTWLPGDLPVAMFFTGAFALLFVVVLRKAHP